MIILSLLLEGFMKNISLLVQSYLLSVLAGCTTTSESQYCINIDADAECPSVEDVNETIFPIDDCGGTHTKSTEFAARNDSVSIWEEDTAADTLYDACCYTTTYKAPVGMECIEGRPLKKGGFPILATISDQQSDWSSGEYSPQRKNLVAGTFWKRSAAMEHSSIAAFHMCALELLQLGAPAHLIAGVQQAAQEELRHAQSAFSIAAQLLQESLHPDSFPHIPIPQRSLSEFALEVAKEGAINETLAVVLAAEQRRHTTDPTIQKHLDTLIQEEAQHALLSWHILQWAIAQEGEGLRTQILALLAEQPSFCVDGFPVQGVHELGILSRQEATQTLNQAWKSLIAPIVQEFSQGYVA